MNRKEQFIMWLKENVRLADSTISKYANAIETISVELVKYDVIKGSLYNISNSSMLESLAMKYLAIPEYSDKDARGNRMYSNALKHYKNFLESL
jgi:hypothetical protein